MKMKSILSSVIIASMSLSSVSFAQQHRNDDNRGHGNGHDARHEDRRDDRRDAREERRDERQERRYYNARSSEFRRGGHIPHELRDRSYVVNDWRGHHLSAPPRGYQWVQVGPDYVLTAIATGLIANLILNQH
jgi:Ni/Co efflux regulator RcnB